MSLISSLTTPVAQFFSTEMTISFFVFCVGMWGFSNYFLVIWINVLQYVFEKKKDRKTADRLLDNYYKFPSWDTDKPVLHYVAELLIILLLMPATFCLIVQKKVIDNRLETMKETEEHIPELEKL